MLSFGRRQPFTYAMDVSQAPFATIDDARLFFSTFVGGLLFMTVYLA
ncbi:hypothetical protein [Sphingomonas sp.]|nr:hypothetical protein [Sphingomonas sp.]